MPVAVALAAATTVWLTLPCRGAASARAAVVAALAVHPRGEVSARSEEAGGVAPALAASRVVFPLAAHEEERVVYEGGGAAQKAAAALAPPRLVDEPVQAVTPAGVGAQAGAGALATEQPPLTA